MTIQYDIQLKGLTIEEDRLKRRHCQFRSNCWEYADHPAAFKPNNFLVGDTKCLAFLTYGWSDRRLSMTTFFDSDFIHKFVQYQ